MLLVSFFATYLSATDIEVEQVGGGNGLNRDLPKLVEKDGEPDHN